MIVMAHVEDQKFAIPCGQGAQTAKWLALAASRRYADLHLPHGRVRHKESVRSSGGCRVPIKMLKKSDGKVIEPLSKLNEVLEDNDAVIVQLQKKIEFAADGYPIPTPWAVQAFSTNTELQQRTSARIKKEMQEAEAKRDYEGKEKIEAAIRIFGAADSKIAEKFEKDWTDIAAKCKKPSTTSPLANGIELIDLKAAIARYYEEILATFGYFCGFVVGEEDMISYTEFAHFVHKAAIFDSVRDQGLIKMVFQEADFEPKEDARNPDGAFSRTDFIEAAVRLSVIKFGTMSVSEGLEKLMHTNILPWMALNRNNHMYETISAPDFSVVAQDNFEKLQRVFYRFCTADQNDTQKAHQLGTMNVNEFNQLMEASGCIERKGDKRRKARSTRRKMTKKQALAAAGKVEVNKFVRLAFNAAQSMPKADDEKEPMPEIRDLNELTFPEFVEALLRFSTLKKREEKRLALAHAAAQEQNLIQGTVAPTNATKPKKIQVNVHEQLEKYSNIVAAVATISSDGRSRQ